MLGGPTLPELGLSGPRVYEIERIPAIWRSIKIRVDKWSCRAESGYVYARPFASFPNFHIVGYVGGIFEKTSKNEKK